MFGGQVGISGHIKIADGVKIGAQSGVPSDIRQENSILLGYPAIEHRDFLRSSILFKRLPEIKTKLDTLEKKVESMKNQ
jgi:UDP-3-O-[3-hydroxymyristoyl] glucosamine N-acyltransferase